MKKLLLLTLTGTAVHHATAKNFESVDFAEILKVPTPKDFHAYVIDVYDGDTFTIIVQTWGQDGHQTFVKKVIRLYGVDTPEIKTKDPKEKELGIIARDFVRERIMHKIVRIEVVAKEKFGRCMAHTFYIDANGNEVNLGDELVATGHARPYFGGKRSPEDQDSEDENDDAYDRED